MKKSREKSLLWSTFREEPLGQMKAKSSMKTLTKKVAFIIEKNKTCEKAPWHVGILKKVVTLLLHGKIAHLFPSSRRDHIHFSFCGKPRSDIIHCFTFMAVLALKSESSSMSEYSLNTSCPVRNHHHAGRFCTTMVWKKRNHLTLKIYTEQAAQQKGTIIIHLII